ncbi:MAG: SMP-30/gluconolactonase/LRE family protein [Sphingomonas sp.]|jgi:sugar lactone lactonase YvrE|uniref:SMP-30/gluconolactonase/LRE family protein n=1 Tax=Sphingomonas sp. TaxID=28214 RepID=UPI00356A8088
MPRTFPRKLIITALLLLAVGLALWLAATLGWFSPSPTRFGWPADLTTAAGDGIRGHSDGPAATARFSDPFAIALARDGTRYVADAGDTNRLRRIAADGTVTTLPGTFDTPSGIALDKAGNIIVADTGANMIRKIDPTGAVTVLAGDGTAALRDGPAARARFDGPIGVAVDGKGNVYVADSYNDRIRRISPDGQVNTLAGGDAPGFADGTGATAAFDTPTGLALDRHGALLVADTGNDAIRRVTPDGHVSTIARADPNDDTGLLKAPVGLASTWDGYLYVAAARGSIVQISPTGAVRALIGPDADADGNAALRLTGPTGLAVDRAGALYVADAASYAIRKLTPRRAGAPAVNAALRAAPPALVTAPVFPWPVRPQTGWHEVVGDMGEVRGNYQGERRDHLHAGLDIRAPVGELVVAAANEKVQDPLPTWDAEGLNEGLRIDQLTYIHMRVGRMPDGTPLDPRRFQLIRDAAGKVTRVRVKRGTRFRVGDPLGTINRMAHVHLELGPPRAKVNALLLLFPGFADHVAPHIDGVRLLDATGTYLTELQNGRLIVPATAGPLDIVANAWDQVDDNEPRRRLGLYKAGFQILKADGTPLPDYAQPRLTIELDRMPTTPDAVKILYAPDSGDTVHSDQPTRMLYVVSNVVRHGRAERGGWNPAGLAPGDYVVRVYAADWAGNVAVSGRDLAIMIR